MQQRRIQNLFFKGGVGGWRPILRPKCVLFPPKEDEDSKISKNYLFKYDQPKGGERRGQPS